MKRSTIMTIIGLVLILVTMGILSVMSSGYRDIDYLLNVDGPREVTVQGKVKDIKLDLKNNLVIFILEGQSQVRVLAYYPLDKFQAIYGGLPSHTTIESKIVINGLYKPVNSSSNIIGEIQIKTILTGCHKAYEAPQVKKIQ